MEITVHLLLKPNFRVHGLTDFECVDGCFEMILNVTKMTSEITFQTCT